MVRQETAHFSSLRFLMLLWTRNPSDAVCSQHTSSIWIRLSFSRNNSQKSIQVTVCPSVSSRFLSVRFCVVWGRLYCVTENPIAGDLWSTLQYAHFTLQYTTYMPEEHLHSNERAITCTRGHHGTAEFHRLQLAALYSQQGQEFTDKMSCGYRR